MLASRVAPFVFALSIAACGSKAKPADAPVANSAPSDVTCMTGQFLSAIEDDGHGVSITLITDSGEKQFYAHDKGNPTRSMKDGDEVWLKATAPGSAWAWKVVSENDCKR